MINKSYKLNEYYEEFISNREAVLACLSSSALTLKFLWKNPSRDIAENFMKPPFFQLYFKNDIMFLLLKFSSLKWIDIPLFFTKNTKNFFSYEGETFPCKIMLANSNTGKLFVNQTFFMPKGITKAFVQAVHTQKDLNKKVAAERINSIRSSYSAEDMSRLSLGKV